MKKIVILIVLIVFTGCIPKMHTVVPKIEGKVIDSITKQPIKDVKVDSVKTNKDGVFSLDGKKELGVGTVMGGVWRVTPRMVVVSQKNYHKMYCTCKILSTQDGCLDVVIELFPEEKSVVSYSQNKSKSFTCNIVKKRKVQNE